MTLPSNGVEELITYGQKPSPRTYHASCSVQNFMAIIGGESTGDNNDLYMLDLEADYWVKPRVIG